VPQKKQSYEELKRELEQILESIQKKDGQDNLDELLELYQRGEEIVVEMQAFLDSAKNKIIKIRNNS
jgi:exodeoxyribonuclease VII small subunit